MGADPASALFALSVVGAILAAWLTPRRPIAAFGIMVLLASLTRWTVETPVGSMRLEQPAIGAVAIVLLATGRLRELASLPRWAWVMGGLLAAYLAVLALSSVLVAPEPTTSLRIVAWWSISFAGGVVAVVLVGPRGESAIEPVGLVAAFVAVVGFIVAILFLLCGPGAGMGVQASENFVPRVYGVAYEANLFASLLVASVPFGLAMTRTGPHRRIGFAVAAVILLAMPLGITRAAYLGLVAGVATYLTVLGWHDRRHLASLGGVVTGVVATAIGIGLAGVLLPSADVEAHVPAAVAEPSPTGSGPTPSPLGAAASTVSPSAEVTPPPPLPPVRDTIAFRLERVPIALADLATSPIIGLGADSFGQRHLDPTIGFAPDHLATLALAVPYESGVLGSLAMIAAFVILVVELWRAASRPASRVAAAAYLASIAALAVAYQATNALHFANNWLIVGAAVALAARSGQASTDDADTTAT